MPYAIMAKGSPWVNKSARGRWAGISCLFGTRWPDFQGGTKYRRWPNILAPKIGIGLFILILIIILELYIILILLILLL